jgi:hypothetical protein
VRSNIKKSGIKAALIHMDNCRVHNSAKTMTRLESESDLIARQEFHVTLHQIDTRPLYHPLGKVQFIANGAVYTIRGF